MIRKAIPLTVIIAGFVILCGVVGGQASAQDNYITLFNGKDLSGWVPVGTPNTFTVKEDSIYSTGAGPYPSWLRTEKEYENFVLRFEYQTEGWYEGGILIHAPLNGPGSKIGLKLHLRHDQKEYEIGRASCRERV